MRGLYDEELDLTEEIKGSLDRFLGCRACETACPSGVPYGELLEKARGVIHETSSQGLIEQTLRTVLLKGLSSILPFCSPQPVNFSSSMR